MPTKPGKRGGLKTKRLSKSQQKEFELQLKLKKERKKTKDLRKKNQELRKPLETLGRILNLAINFTKRRPSMTQTNTVSPPAPLETDDLEVVSEKPPVDAVAHLANMVEKLLLANQGLSEENASLNKDLGIILERCQNLDQRVDLIEKGDKNLQERRSSIYQNLKEKDDRLDKLLRSIEERQKARANKNAPTPNGAEGK